MLRTARESAQVFIQQEKDALYALLVTYYIHHTARLRRAILDRLHELEMME